MSIENSPDPDEYTPDLGPISAAEEYQPEPSLDDPAREANPADVAEQAVELPADDSGQEQLDDDDDFA